MLFKKLAFVAAAASANAQRPSDTPICDYYTTALLKNNTAENQLALLTVLVNTVVIGNCKSLHLSVNDARDHTLIPAYGLYTHSPHHPISCTQPSHSESFTSIFLTNMVFVRHRTQCWHHGPWHPRPW